LLLVIEGTVNVALAVSEINTGPAVWRPVTDRPADVVEVGLPFTADQARRAGVSLD
jgi:D-psicose/D-tagatose/L-ribulose 3-epimerase